MHLSHQQAALLLTGDTARLDTSRDLTPLQMATPSCVHLLQLPLRPAFMMQPCRCPAADLFTSSQPCSVRAAS